MPLLFMDGFEKLSLEELEKEFDKSFPGDSKPIKEATVLEIEVHNEDGVHGLNYIGAPGHYKIIVDRFGEIHLEKIS